MEILALTVLMIAMIFVGTLLGGFLWHIFYARPLEKRKDDLLIMLENQFELARKYRQELLEIKHKK